MTLCKGSCKCDRPTDQPYDADDHLYDQNAKK
jgi:hypothetical protein